MLWILFLGAALPQCFRILVLVPASEMASKGARMVDDAVEAAFAGSPESIPAVIMEIVHYIRRTNITTDTICHGCWASLTDVSDSRFLGLRWSFDYLGRFAYVHDYNKQCEWRRGERDSAHRQMGHDYSGVDYRKR